MDISTLTSCYKMVLSLLLLLGAILHATDATSCTSLTKNTCQKTLHVTSTCSSGKCTCVSGYEYTREGCIAIISPTVAIVATDGTSTAIGSGEVLLGGSITLRCEPNNLGDGNYVWMKETESAALPGDRNAVLTINDAVADNTGKYMCKVKMDAREYESKSSSAVTVTVVASDGTFQKRPIVTGMLPKSLNNGVMSLTCTNVPSGLTLTYEWYMAGEKLSGQTTKAYTLTVTDQKLAKEITCKIGKASADVVATFASPESAVVTTPSSLTGDISGVKVQEGTSVVAKTNLQLRLTCMITDTDLAVAADSVAYTWTLNGTAIDGATTYRYTKANPTKTGDKGLYKCVGKVGTKPARESEGTDVIVLIILIWDDVTLTVSPQAPLEKSYVIMECGVQTRDSSLISYRWTKNNAVLQGEYDRAIQINDMDADDAGSYTCSGSVGMDQMSATFQLPAPVAMSSVTPTVQAPPMANGEQFGVGNTYVLTCASNQHTPGMTYKWLEGDTEISGQTGQTYSLKAKTGSNTYLCQMTFNGETSTTSPALTVNAKNIVSVTMALINVSVSAFPNYQPLTGAKVTLKCLDTLAASASGSVTYAWLRAGTVIAGETTETYAFTAGTTTNGAVKCRATLSGESLESSAFTVTASDTIVTPAISILNNDVEVLGGPVFVEGGSYELVCSTASHSEDLDYTYLKNGNTISGPIAGMRTFTLEDLKKGTDGDDGTYKCKASKVDKSATSSNSVVLAVDVEGKPCRYDADCEGKGYSGVCSVNDNRCECSGGYSKDGNTCSSGVKLAVSGLLLAILAVFSRLF